ncbi:CLIP domain-containing serine protease B9-like [Ischnura elegans]|uniref:CLIP domain-containing serine protease B9-like n=1 Tax=Ischnura elegans TaxID=197161 RepID=UPI001ED87672|nr:CLIP domain-containing serine protease B9-like [Ischnura elegans]
MAAARTRNVFRVVFILLLLQFVEPRFKTRRASAAGETVSSQPSAWENFIRKVQKPFRTVDSAFLLLGVSKSSKSSKDRPVTLEITTASTTASTAPPPESMGRMLMDPDIGTTPKRIPKPATPTPPKDVDPAAWNLMRLSNDPCGASPSNMTYGNMLILLGEFPWLALLRFSDENNTMENFCAGSLINDRYVLTIASCLTAPGHKLTHVRLGEYNVGFHESDCTDVEEGLNDVVAIEACYGDPPVDYAISTTHAYPKYDPVSGEFNVALIRLAKKVEYTPLISPVCLPVGDMAVSWNVGDSSSDLVLAGWGDNLIPSEAFVYNADPSECEEATGDEVLEGQMCGIGVDGSDLCHGDLGAPLFSHLKMKSRSRSGGSGNVSAQPAARYVQLGLLISKSAYCQDEPPLIFDNVERFLPWILATMKP